MKSMELIPISIYPFIFFLLSIFFSRVISESDTTSSTPLKLNSQDIHDVLTMYNLPKGILPTAVSSYSLSPKDGSFVVEMEHPCYVRFKFSIDGDDQDQLVYYGKVIKGKLSYGSVSHVSGIQANKFFIWVSITALSVDSNSDMVEFHAGSITQKLPAQLFHTIPTCSTSSLGRLDLVPWDLAF